MSEGDGDIQRWQKGSEHPKFVESRFKPGQSGNLSGRAAGVTYPGDWIRGLCGLTRADLMEVVNNPAAPASKVGAAKKLLRTCADLADFSSILVNQHTPESLRAAGTDTSALKRVSISHTENGANVSVEMHDPDRALDGIMDRTEGKPNASVTVSHEDKRSAAQLIEDMKRAAGVAGTKEA